MENEKVKKSWVKKILITLSIIIAFYLLIFLASYFYIQSLIQRDHPHNSDVRQAKNIQNAIQLLVTETNNTDLILLTDERGNKLLPNEFNVVDIIKLLQSQKIYYNNKHFGPYLESSRDYSVQWNEDNGGVYVGYYARIYKDLQQVVVVPVSKAAGRLVNAVDIFNISDELAKTPIPTPF